jgi:hypothetical protein
MRVSLECDAVALVRMSLECDAVALVRVSLVCCSVLFCGLGQSEP